MAVESSPIYNYIRKWFEYAFANTDKVRPIHAAIYLWHVELNNRLGWVTKFGSPATQTMAACGIHQYKTYKKAFDELVEWGFIFIVTESKNQYVSSIVALVKNTEALPHANKSALVSALVENTKATTKANKVDSAMVKNTEAPPKALPKHSPKQTPHNKTNILIEKQTIEIENTSDAIAPVLAAKKKITPKKVSVKKNIVKPEEPAGDDDTSEPVGATPFWKQLIKTWYSFYSLGCPPHFKGFKTTPTFGGVEASAMKKLMRKLRQKAVEIDHEWTEDYAIRCLKHFLTKAVSDPWIVDNFMMHILNQKFDIIIQKNENGKQQSITNNGNIKGHQPIDMQQAYAAFSSINNDSGKQ